MNGKKNRLGTKNLNREEILKLMQKKDWVSLIQKFKNNEIYNLIQNDEMLPKIIENNFVNELIIGNSFAQESAYPYYLEQFYVLHKGDNFKFQLKESDFEKLIEKIVNEYYQDGKLENAFKYATEYPKNERCKKIIEEYETEQLKTIHHSQSNKITLKKNDEISKIDNTTSLFKSKQEYRFYRAVREVFQSFMVFPNVGINTVINFDTIKNELSQEERRFYFMGLIDCVVIDQENDYKPIKFVELDSITHDNKKQQNNDRMKDKIIGLAGHKLYRIRRDSKEITENEFISLIRENIKED